MEVSPQYSTGAFGVGQMSLRADVFYIVTVLFSSGLRVVFSLDCLNRSDSVFRRDPPNQLRVNLGPFG